MKKNLIILLSLLSGVMYSQTWRSTATYAEPAKPTLPKINSSGTNGSLGTAASILQQRYNNNVNRVQENINNIVRQINNLNASETRINNILYYFKAKCIDQLGNYDYTNNNTTNNVINYLYQCGNNQIKNN